MITTVVIDEVHNRSAHSDYVLALTPAVMQKTPDLRLVLMSATGDHKLVRERMPHCQQLVMTGSHALREEIFSCTAHGQIVQHAEHDCTDCDHISQ